MNPGSNQPKPPGQRRRRNVTGVKPDHNVPISGRQGPSPKSPLPLGRAGAKFWRWAWHTPQACQFHDGFTFTLAVLAALHDEYELSEPPERGRIGTRIEKGYVEFGLTPRSMSALHLFVVEDEKADPQTTVADAVPDESELAMRRRAKGIKTG